MSKKFYCYIKYAERLFLKKGEMFFSLVVGVVFWLSILMNVSIAMAKISDNVGLRLASIEKKFDLSYGKIKEIIISPNKEILAIIVESGIYFYDLERSTFIFYTPASRFFNFSNDGQYLIYQNEDKINILEIKTKTNVFSIDDNSYYNIKNIIFNVSTRQLILTDSQKKIEILTLTNNFSINQRGEIKEENFEKYFVSPNGEKLLFLIKKNMIKILTFTKFGYPIKECEFKIPIPEETKDIKKWKYSVIIEDTEIIEPEGIEETRIIDILPNWEENILFISFSTGEGNIIDMLSGKIISKIDTLGKYENVRFDKVGKNLYLFLISYL